MSGRVWAGALLLLLLLCVGCGQPDPGSRPGTLPPLTDTPTLATTSAATTSTTATPTEPASPGPTSADEHAVRKLYLDWSKNYLEAQDMAAGIRRSYLARWLVDPALSDYLDILATSDEQYVRVDGPRVSHVFAVSVSGTAAHVDDCTDVSRQVLKDTRTGRAVGKRLHWVWTKATLRRTGAGWRISEVQSSLKSCAKRIGGKP